jgi:predicted transcriptional regulator of viral defense system
MILKKFFLQHPVFTTSEFTEHLGREEKRNVSTRDNLLAYHVNKGHLLRVKQGLYVVVSSDMATMDFSVDPYLLASRMAEDAVLAYHTALDFHSKSYSVYNQFLYLTKHSVRKVSFRNYIFKAVRPPKPLLDQNQSKFGVVSQERNGLKIEVTSLERTLVDLFDKPHLGGGWEEVWRSLESVEFYNINEVIEYALLLNNATTVAKVGFFLEKNQKRFFVDTKDLQKLKKGIPRQPHYMDKKLKGKFVRQWNLIVPEKILEKSWGEVL